MAGDEAHAVMALRCTLCGRAAAVTEAEVLDRSLSRRWPSCCGLAMALDVPLPEGGCP